tara:strand:- start:47 stop:958 length:912 start_codon:yes stop_codon:yes gene_type:complete
MNFRLENSKLIFRKLKISDYKEFKKLFYSCFKKKISYDFFKWRYFSDKFSFCYGVFDTTKLIANVGMKSMKLNNKKNERIFSRHSSMVLSKYRGRGIFSELLEEVKKIFLNDASIIVMWPNENNFASFGIVKKRIIKRKYYLYNTSNRKIKIKKTSNHNIDQLSKFKIFIQSNDNFFLKNFDYFKNRYLSYKNNEYLINKFELKKFTSFFILKKNKDKLGLNYVILDHFGSKYIKSKHLSQLINEMKVIFWSKQKIHKLNNRFINHINLSVGFIKKIDVLKKNTILVNKEFMLGDTDRFITIK